MEAMTDDSRRPHQDDLAVQTAAVETTGQAPEVTIRATGLRKSYGDTAALDGFDLEIRRGEVFALLGPNGAGKTTAVEILEGYRRRDAGDVHVLGLDPAR